MPEEKTVNKGRFGENKISFPDVPQRTRHVPGVIKHGPEVFFTRSDVYSHLRPNSFTPFLISQRSRTVAREKPCRSTPDASVSVLDASWAPQTPIPAMGMLQNLRILTQDDYGSRYARRGATGLTDGGFELDKVVVAPSRRSVSVPAGRSAGCVSTAWYQLMCEMLNIRPAGRQAGPRSMKRSS